MAEGRSSRFTLSTGDGLNNLLASMLAFRDPMLHEDETLGGAGEHGSAFERISAFQFGFTDGAHSCAAIDATEITARRGGLPVQLGRDQTGEEPVSRQSVQAIVDAMNILFRPVDPPKLSFDAKAAAVCSDARPSPPAVSGLLTNGLVASDVNGDSVPSGFSRIDAFRVGVLGDTARCIKRFP